MRLGSDIMQHYEQGQEFHTCTISESGGDAIATLRYDHGGRINVEAFDRADDYDSEFDGVLANHSDIVAALTEKYGKDHVFSSSRLETYATCGFRLFLDSVIGLGEPPEGPEHFDQRVVGSMVHDILEEFFKERKSSGADRIDPDNSDEAKEQLRTIGEDVFSWRAFDSPIWESAKRMYLGTPQDFPGLFDELIDVEAQERLRAFSPEHFEFAIGNPRRRRRSAAGAAVDREPARLPEGGAPEDSFLFHGYIDRIDTDSEGHFVIFDYKTGAYETRIGDIKKGKSYQLPLYLLAAEQALGLKGVGASYYRVREPTKVAKHLTFGEKAHQTTMGTLGKDRGVINDFREVLKSSVDSALDRIGQIRAGSFVPLSDLSDCPKYCQFLPICQHCNVDA